MVHIIRHSGASNPSLPWQCGPLLFSPFPFQNGSGFKVHARWMVACFENQPNFLEVYFSLVALWTLNFFSLSLSSQRSTKINMSREEGLIGNTLRGQR